MPWIHADTVSSRDHCNWRENCCVLH